MNKAAFAFRPFLIVMLMAASVGLAPSRGVAAADPLPSWRSTDTKSAILAFVARVATPGSPEFVPEPERIAVFDNDGTLWAEKPIYAQIQFALDRVKALAPEHPEWAKQPPLSHLIAGDIPAFMAEGEKALIATIAATHAGLTTEEFNRVVSDWIATARHPTTGRPYAEMAYQPMLELLACLRAHGFKTYIVSNGGIDFIRPWAEKTYGIPPEQVIGSSGKLKYEQRADGPALVKLPEIDFVGSGPGKPVAIQLHIGRRPIAAFGNADDDLEMLQWTAAGPGPRFAALVHHDDFKREWGYDRESGIGKLDKAWNEALRRNWTVVSMRDDWGFIYPPAPDSRPVAKP